MKKIVVIIGVLVAANLQAQMEQGKIIYERSMQMPARSFNINGMEQSVPASMRKDKFELTYANNQSIWKQAAPDNESETTNFGGEGGGLVIRSVVAGSNNVVFHDFNKAARVEKQELFDRIFIVEDSIRPLKWKMTGETKNILNHRCMKATTYNVVQRMQMSMENGKMERKEITDTIPVTAWVAADIPVSAGPAEYQGQLPGLILEMDINNGSQVYTALEITPKADIATIKEPSGKKRYTPEEFRNERNKMFEEMNRNSGGSNRRFIMN